MADVLKDDKPTIADMKDQKLFRCKNCSTESEGQVWWSWNEALKEPTPKEETRTLLKCPTCKNTLGIHDLKAEVDITAIPEELRKS